MPELIVRTNHEKGKASGNKADGVFNETARYFNRTVV